MNSKSKFARNLALAVLALAATGVANAATLQIEAANGYFLAEAFPEGSGYQYSFTASANLITDYAQHNTITGYCIALAAPTTARFG